MSLQTHITAHKRMIETAEFQRAIQFAQLQYLRRLHEIAPDKLDTAGFANAAAMCFERLQGMEDFIKILINLAEPLPVPELRIVEQTLDQTK